MIVLDEVLFQGYARFYSGLGKKEVHIKFSDDDRFVMITGDNGAGKTTLLQNITPDARTEYSEILIGETGRKMMRYRDTDTGVKYQINHIFTPVKDAHQVKSHITMIDEKGKETDLNPNGSVKNFQEIKEGIFGIDNNVKKLLHISSTEKGVTDLTTTERRKYYHGILPLGNIDIYAKEVSSSLRDSNRELKATEVKLNKYPDINKVKIDLSTLKKDIKRLEKELEENTKKLGNAELIKSKLKDAKEKHEKIQGGINELNKLYKSLVVHSDEFSASNDLMNVFSEAKFSKTMLLTRLDAENISTNEKIANLNNKIDNLNNSSVESDFNALSEKVIGSNLEPVSITKEDFSYEMELFNKIDSGYDMVSSSNIPISTISSFYEDYKNLEIGEIHKIVDNKHNLIKSSIAGMEKEIEDSGMASASKIASCKPNCRDKECHLYKLYINALEDNNNYLLIKQKIAEERDDLEKISEERANIDQINYQYNRLKLILVAINKSKLLKDMKGFRNINIDSLLSSSFSINLSNAKSELDIINSRISYTNDLVRLNELKNVLKASDSKNDIENLDKTNKARNKIEEELSKTKIELKEAERNIKELYLVTDSMHIDLNDLNLSQVKEKLNGLNAVASDASNEYMKLLESSSLDSESVDIIQSKIKSELEECREMEIKYNNEINIIETLDNELKIVSDTSLELDVLKNILGIKIPTMVMDTFLEEIKDETNEFLESSDSEYRINRYIISDEEFVIEILKDQYIIPDASKISSGQRSLILLSQTFALRNKILTSYRDLTLDEVDGPLKRGNKEKYMEMLLRQSTNFTNGRMYMVTHSEDVFQYMQNGVSVISFKDADIDDLKANVIYRVD